VDEVTRILHAIEQGDRQATDQLLAIVYDELRRLAAAKLAHEKPGQTLQATALVHEAYLRLLPAKPDDGGDRATPGELPRNSARWQSRAHFLAAAAEAMRRILVENARRKHRLKRGGGHARVDLDAVDLAVEPPSDDVLALDEALAKLEQHDKAKADVVKLRYSTGLTIEETAAVLGISEPTVKRYWSYARVWLLREISHGKEPSS